MAASLNHTWSTLCSSIGHYLGFGDDPADFTDSQKAQVERALDGGYRRCCYPPNYSWSWMMATRIVCQTKSDVFEYPLPPVIGNVSGPLTVETSSTSHSSVKLFHEGALRQCRSQYPAASGRPSKAAVFHARSAPGMDVGKHIAFWPTPDGTYVIQGKCQLRPLPIREDNPAPLGDQEFAQMLLEACLAEAERQMDDLQGVHNMAFQEQLLVALEQDKRHRMEFMGQMLDPMQPEATAFMTGGSWPWGLSNQFTVTYNGVEYVLLLASAALWHLAQMGMTR